MSLIAKESGGSDFTPIPAGLHHAVCVAVFDLGTHFSEKWGKKQHKVTIGWECPEERIDVEIDGKKVNVPRRVYKRYTLSLSKNAALRKDLEAWRGRPFTSAELEGFDLTKLLGVNGYLNMIHNVTPDGKTWANIGSIAPLRGKDSKLTPESEPIYFSFADGSLPGENIPEWARKIMSESDEYKAMTGAPQVNDDDAPPPPGDDDYNPESDVPF